MNEAKTNNTPSPATPTFIVDDEQPVLNGVLPDRPATLIFIVDDEPMLLDLAAAILQPLGYEVRTFRDPKVALAEFSTAKPVLLVTDYAMGGMNGMDLIRECKRIHPAQKIILLSGTVDEAIYSNETAQPDLFLAKPYQIKSFVEAVRQLAGR